MTKEHEIGLRKYPITRKSRALPTPLYLKIQGNSAVKETAMVSY